MLECACLFSLKNCCFSGKLNLFGGPVICNGVVCSGTTPRCDSGTCKCSKTANALDEGDGTTKGSCSGSNEKCQMSGSCVEDGKQQKNILVISIYAGFKYCRTKSLS